MSSLAMANTPGAQPPKPSISGSFLISGTHDSPRFHPVSAIHSALHKADLLLLSASTPGLSLPTLPVSPYPVHPGAAIRAHFVTDKQPEEDGWRPWIGHTWSKWVKGTVLGYRDFAGREAKVCRKMTKHIRSFTLLRSLVHTMRSRTCCSNHYLLQVQVEVLLSTRKVALLSV